MEVRYILFSEALGAPKAELTLTSETEIKGTAYITQPVSPAVNFKIPVYGKRFTITQKVNGFEVVGDQNMPGGPTFGAAIVTPRLGEIGKGTFWWADSNGLHESGIVEAKPVAVGEPVAV